MSATNKSAKEELIRLYGDGCFFERDNLPEKLEKMGIKGYKVFVKKAKYSGKPIAKQLTYHHLVHKSNGGKATVENGANLSYMAHQYIHSLPREQEELINNELRNFKYSIDVARLKVGDKSLSFDKIDNIDMETEIRKDPIDYIIIPLEKNEKELRKNNFNRAREKKEFKRKIKEYEEDFERNR